MFRAFLRSTQFRLLLYEPKLSDVAESTNPRRWDLLQIN